MIYRSYCYNVIYADPPWTYKDKGFASKVYKDKSTTTASFSPNVRYDTMSLDDIINMGPWIKHISKLDCALFLWATSPLLPEALSVMEAWGFKYKTVAFCWSKITETGLDVCNLGQWTLGNVELCLVGSKGRPYRYSTTTRQLVRAIRTIHSKKPDEVRDRIVEVMGEDCPKIELFAREIVDGWDFWGNEVEDKMELIHVNS